MKILFSISLSAVLLSAQAFSFTYFAPMNDNPALQADLKKGQQAQTNQQPQSGYSYYYYSGQEQPQQQQPQQQYAPQQPQQAVEQIQDQAIPQ